MLGGHDGTFAVPGGLRPTRAWTSGIGSISTSRTATSQSFTIEHVALHEISRSSTAIRTTITSGAGQGQGFLVHPVVGNAPSGWSTSTMSRTQSTEEIFSISTAEPSSARILLMTGHASPELWHSSNKTTEATTGSAVASGKHVPFEQLPELQHGYITKPSL